MKRNLAITLITAASLVACLSFTGFEARQAGGSASFKRGKEVYTQTCLTCHQASGTGVQNMNPPLVKTKWVLGDKKKLAAVVLNGLNGEIEINGDTYSNNMPALGSVLTDQQIADVLTYVRNSFGNKASAVSVADVKASRAKPAK